MFRGSVRWCAGGGGVVFSHSRPRCNICSKIAPPTFFFFSLKYFSPEITKGGLKHLGLL